MHADGADAAAAVSQEPQAEVGAQLSVLLEQQLWELSPQGHTGTGQPLPLMAQKVPDGDSGRGISVLPPLAKHGGLQNEGKMLCDPA